MTSSFQRLSTVAALYERRSFPESNEIPVIEGVNEFPLLAEEGWLRQQLKVAKPPKAPQTGAERERDSAKP